MRTTGIFQNKQVGMRAARKECSASASLTDNCPQFTCLMDHNGEPVVLKFHMLFLGLSYFKSPCLKYPRVPRNKKFELISASVSSMSNRGGRTRKNPPDYFKGSFSVFNFCLPGSAFMTFNTLKRTPDSEANPTL